MTKKDYEVIAKVIALAERKEWGSVGAILSEQNPNFDPVKFWWALDQERKK